MDQMSFPLIVSRPFQPNDLVGSQIAGANGRQPFARSRLLAQRNVAVVY